MSGPLQYFKEVRQEAAKVTWPTRQETIASTIAVFVMVIMASLFLFVADQLLAYIVSLILSIGSN